MTLEEAITAIRTAPNRHKAQVVANAIAMACMNGERDASDEAAVRAAWFERWGHESTEWFKTSGYCGPRAGGNWTGD